MFTRRDVVTTGAIGALSSAALGGPLAAHAAAASPDGDGGVALMLGRIELQLKDIEGALNVGFRQTTLSQGPVAKIREQFTMFARANFKFPDYCEVGIAVFYDLYDWHVKHAQPLQFAQHQGRMTLRFMFTQMILRAEQDPHYISEAFDMTRPG